VSRDEGGSAAGSAGIRPVDAHRPTMPAWPDLVLFDLDHTLLDGDSNQLWLGWLVERGAVPATRLAQQAEHYARYQAGTLDIDAYLAFHLSMLVERSVADWRPLRDAFVAERIAPRIGPAARAAVEHHRARGDALAVVTATHDFLAEGIVVLLGAPPLVATRCEVADGRFTGRVDGVPCFAQAKPGCVRDWLAAAGRRWEDFGAVRFYSDSANDLPLLEAVSHPVVVDPDPRLAAIAVARGWPRQSWARNAGG
jgi:HAD superfamily hydrolase (TIGR01490 family)